MMRRNKSRKMRTLARGNGPSGRRIGRFDEQATVDQPLPVGLASELVERFPDHVVVVHNGENLGDIVAVDVNLAEIDASVSINRGITTSNHGQERVGVGKNGLQSGRCERVGRGGVIMREGVKLALDQRSCLWAVGPIV